MQVDPVRVEAIFGEALMKAGAAARAAYLDQACGDDAPLRDRIEALLAAHDATANFLKLPDADPATNPATALGEGPGSKIGHYKLLEQIGEGGFGVVFMAHQTEPVQRKVALKIIKPGMDTRQVIARFEAERQALAMMDHPHIAKVLDAGSTDSGRPYFVMELVKGVPINQYCDEHHLAPRERLELFISVCQAVQHAHQKGIIHRDLKPTNVLVAEYDERPAAMVIDFGVAKAIGRPLTEKTLFTEFGQVVGTIDYMSPEQAKLNQLDIDTRTDIYSLGVLLYELLAGSTPLDRKRLHSAAFDEMLRIIREDEPPSPSTRLSSSDQLASISANRSLEPRKLTGLLRGELDWIVMKSLEKERSRRYETANGLARDIERYLHDDPVEARPPSAGYRFRKFARRNKAAILTVGLVAAVLVTGTMVSTWQAIRATRAEELAEVRLSAETKARTAEAEQRKIAETERAEAEKQRATAEANYQKAKAAVNKYFTLVSESTLLDVPGLEPLRKDLLDAALEFYEGAALERTDDPAVLADVAATLLRASQIYIGLNRQDEAFAMIQKALDVIERLRRDYPRGGSHELKLAGFWKGYRWTQWGVDLPQDLPGAFQAGFRLEAIWKELGEAHPAEAGFQADLVWIQNEVGSGLTATGRTNEANAYFRKARVIAEKLISDYPQVPQYRSDLALVNYELAKNLFVAGDLNEALALIRQGVQLSEGLVAEFPHIPAYRAQLARSLKSLGNQLAKTQPQQTEQSYRRAMELGESLVGEFPGHFVYLQIWAKTAEDWVSFEALRSNDSKIPDAVQKLIDYLESQIDGHPKDRNTRFNLAVICHYLGLRFGRAGTHLDLADRLFRLESEVAARFVADFPEDRKSFEMSMAAHRDAAGTLWGRNWMDQAAGIYQRAVEIIVKRANGRPVPPEDMPVCANMAAKLASIMAWGAHTVDSRETCRLCLRATDVLKENLEKDPLRQAYLAAPLRRFVDRLGPELKNIPEAEQLLVWSSPIVERTILDVSLLAATTTSSNANIEDRYASGDAQRQLCHFLGSAGRSAQAFEISLLNLRSYASFASERADQRFMIPHVLGDVRQILGARVDELLKDGHADEAATAIRQTIDVIDKLITKDPKSGDDYRATRLGLWNRLSQVLADAGRADEATEARREFAGAAEALMLKGSSQLEFKGELTGTTFDWATTVASLNTDPEGQQLIARSIEGLEVRIRQNPKDQMARFRLAALTHRLAERRFARAIDEASAEQYQRQALELFRGLGDEVPSDTVFLEHVGWSFRNFGGICRTAGRFDEARDHYQAAADIWSKMAADKNVPQRDGWFKRWEADNLVQLAEVLAAGGQTEEAADAAQRGVEICEALVVEYPRNGEYRSNAQVAARFLAQWLVDAGRPQEAVELARRQIAVFEKQQADFPQENLKNTIGSAYLTLALPLTAGDEMPEGKQACDKALELLAGDTATLNYFAWPLAASKDVKPAVAALAMQAAEQAVKAAPNSSSLWNTLGVAQYRAGKWVDAIVSLAKSEELAPEKYFASNGFFLAMAHWQLDHKDEARKWYDQSVEWMDKNQPKNEELVRFRAEAEQLLGITQARPTSNVAPQVDDAEKPKK